MLSKSVGCYNDTIHERRLNHHSKLHGCLLLRNCHSPPAVSNHHPDLSAASAPGKKLCQQTGYNPLKAQTAASMFSNTVFFKLRCSYNNNVENAIYFLGFSREKRKDIVKVSGEHMPHL